MIPKTVRLAAVIAAASVAGCITTRGGSLSQTAERDWGETLARAEAAAGDHRYADADRMLVDFANRYPGTPGAVESAYWRALIALAPANHDGAPQTAAALFESYSKAGGPLPHHLEAEILRDLALHLPMSAPPSLAVATPNAATQGSPGASTADLKAKDTEIQRLKDELAKANDELERIKRRLTAPTKP